MDAMQSEIIETESKLRHEAVTARKRVAELQSAYEDIVHQLMMTQRQLDKLRQ